MDIWLVMPTEGSKEADVRPRNSFSGTKVYVKKRRGLTLISYLIQSEVPPPSAHKNSQPLLTVQLKPPSNSDLQGHHLQTAMAYAEGPRT